MTLRDRRSFLKTGAALGTIGVSGLAGCSGVIGGETPPLTLAFTVPVENIASLFAIPEIQEQLSNLGSAYELEVQRDQSTPDSLNSMAAGNVDMALLSTVSYASAVRQEAVPGNISMIATDFWDAHPEWYGITVFSGPDSDVQEPEDLEGATIGVNATGTGVHALIVKQMQQLGLDPESDAEIVELPFPTFVSAINDGRIDCGTFPAIFAVSARGEGFTEVYSSQDTWEQAYPFAYTVASNNALDEKGDAIGAWGEDFREMVNYAYDNRDEVVSLAAEYFELPEPLVDGFFLTNNDYYRQDLTIDTDRLQFTMDQLVDLGFVEESFDVTQYATNEYIPES
ncbi:ABC transporter substrate-binding protein [Halobellus clavatus]|jgi:NitT/TauT family transport system substrate-binding protein|uniref:NitT/TauT family transport system substrate-binding protein n=1 Tax=Halobellus clavatus TaxID=660517 RepID=A0A1H3FUS0_9EURY|nr:ABC transporter substrate-binding protein [Halobellus clavatus]SDX94680.1 NitT/TauT family transport system substrate-binding protein [Halobellus clavatus]